jgi:YYY domain-containing protein
VLLAAIGALALGVRLYGLDWDEGHHLHPDERLISLVDSDTHWPSSPRAYFDTRHSPLNPNRHASYAYGTLPLFLGKAVAAAAGRSGYDHSYLAGRALTAVFDTGTVLLLFALGASLWSRRTGLLAALLLALSVLPIQLAHFWTVDPYLTFFTTATLLFSVRVAQRGRPDDYALCGAMLGLALACKVTALTLLIVPLGAAALRLVGRSVGPRPFRGARRLRLRAFEAVAGLAGVGAVGFFVFRLAQPYAFAGPRIWDIGLDSKFVAVLREQRALTSGTVGYPPFVQWADRAGFVFPFENMALFGLGLPLALAALAGFVYAGYRLLRFGDVRVVLPLLVVVSFVGAYGGRFVAFARYFEPAYPPLVLLAAVALAAGWRRARAAGPGRRLRPRLEQRALAAAPAAVVLLTALWALAFLHVYSGSNTRIEASRWIYAHVPAGAGVTQEDWDDGLPLGLGAGEPSYRPITLQLYGTDSRAKVEQLVSDLDRADYVILSSDRLRKSIPRIPAQYPTTARYYRALDDGSLGFALVAKFDRPPEVLGIRFPDDALEESLSVYDHPVVRIYRRTPSYTHRRALALLLAAHPERAVTLTPKQGDVNGLLLRPEQARIQQAGGSWSPLFGTKTSDGSYVPETPMRAEPALAWILALELLSLAAAPFVLVLLRSLPDRGYPLAKPLGLLLLAFPVWLAVSVGLVRFTPAAVEVWGLILILLAGGFAFRRRVELGRFVRASWRAVVLAEVVFLGVFLAFYAIRLANPDLWEAFRGGEKPMDFAYLNAVIKSSTLPPYDPWFAGGTLNYYYFGQFLTATLVKPLGIAPEVAYNLAVPMFAAFTAVATFSLGSNLVAAAARRGSRDVSRAAPVTGLVATALVLGVGNLDAASQWSRRLQALDGWHLLPGTRFPGHALALVGGLWSWLVRGGHLMPFDWWGPSRAIPHSFAITEFPFWTFFFADLHAHLMALPFAITATSVALALLLAGAERARLARRLGLLVLLGLLLGALRALNTWDVPTQAALAVAAALGCVWLVHRRFGWVPLRAALGHVSLLLASAWVFFLPYTSSTENFSGRVVRTPETTPIQYYLVHFGVLLLPAVGLVGARASRLGLKARRAWLVLAAVAIAVALVAATTSYETAAAAIALAGLTAAVATIDLRRGAAPVLAAAYTLLVTGLLVTAAVEVVRVRNDIERQNTVFKFYEQAWWLFAVAGAVGVWAVWDAVGRRRAERALRPREAGLAAAWAAGVALLVAAGALYPLSAVGPRVRDRFAATPWTSDGTAYMPHAKFGDDHGTYDLGRDYRAILWARGHIDGSPVILEGVTPNYRWGNRFSIYTGLPAVIGWDFHQTQQRLAYQAEVEERRRSVAAFYGTTSPSRALGVLERYDVRYVFVGELERRYYARDGLAKIAGLRGLTRVYDGAGVQIYRVDQDAVARALA